VSRQEAVPAIHLTIIPLECQRHGYGLALRFGRGGKNTRKPEGETHYS